MKIIVGFCAKAGRGKDTCSDYLVKQYNFKKIAFADPIRQVAKTLFQFCDSQLTNHKEKESIDERINKTPRQVMQEIGMMFREKYGPNFWVDRTLSPILNSPEPNRLFCISDVRFTNEIEELLKLEQEKRAKVVLIKIENQKDFEKNQVQEHISESIVDTHPASKFHLIIQNTSSLDSLYRKLDHMIRLFEIN